MIKKTKHNLKNKKTGGYLLNIDNIIKSQSYHIKTPFVYKTDSNKKISSNKLKKFLLTDNKHKQIDRITKVYNQYINNCCKKKQMLKNAHNYYVKLYEEYKKYINIILNSQNKSSNTLYKIINNLISNISNKKILSKKFIEKSLFEINNTRNNINRLKEKFDIKNISSDKIISDSLSSFDKDNSLSNIIDKMNKLLSDKDKQKQISIDKLNSDFSNIGSKSYVFGGGKKKTKKKKL